MTSYNFRLRRSDLSKIPMERLVHEAPNLFQSKNKLVWFLTKSGQNVYLEFFTSLAVDIFSISSQSSVRVYELKS